MRAGRLRHRLQLQQPTRTSDSHGGYTTTWTTTATVWGSIEALTGWENFTADQVGRSLMVRVVIRYGSGWSSISPTWRVKDAKSGRKYDINAVIQPEHRARPKTVIELMCTESEKDDE